jgi:hypothetical protein
MNIFHIGGGARAALFALAVLFASLLGMEQAAAQSAAVAPFGVTPTEFVDTGSLAVASLTASDDPSHPACALCAAAAIGNAALFAIPTLFLLPEAVDLLNRSTGAEFVRLRSSRAKGTS